MSNHVVDRLDYTLSEVAAFHPVTQFDGLVLSCGGSAWDGGATDGSACKVHVRFKGGIAS